MAEGARLESVYTGNRIVGSNPTPSAKSLFACVVGAGANAELDSGQFAYLRKLVLSAGFHGERGGQLMAPNTWLPIHGSQYMAPNK